MTGITVSMHTGTHSKQFKKTILHSSTDGFGGFDFILHIIDKKRHQQFK